MQRKNLALAPTKHFNTLLKNDVKRSVYDANVILSSAVDRIKACDFVEFSSLLGDQDASVCYTALVAHRISSKFSFGDSVVDTKAVAFKKYVDFEETHCKHISESYDFWGPTNAHLKLRLSASLLRKWFRNFDFDLKDCMIEFTPGETFISSKGMTSIASKLSDLNHWTTTYSSLDLTCMLIYNNAGLKRAAREHIGHVSRPERRVLFSRFRGSDDVGFCVFKELLISRVLTFVSGARASSVPKNTETDRFINVEAMFPMMLQRIIAATLRRILSRVGNGLSNQTVNNLSAQDLHGLLIKFDHFATIDFSNASDSVLTDVIAQIFPRSVCNALVSTRSQIVDFGDFEVTPYKLSSMGNGFTFEVMTVLLYAVVSVFTPFGRVYGDDVILPNDCTEGFIKACELIGFQVNGKKSFINSRFRESCGSFYHDDAGYLRSFDIRSVSSVSDIITTCNKLFMVLNNDHTQLLDLRLVSILSQARTDLLLLIPVLQKGVVPLTDSMRLQNLSLYAFDSNCHKKHSKNAIARTLWRDAIDVFDDPSVKSELTTSVVVLVPRWKPDRVKNVSRKVLFLCAIFSGRSVVPTIKGSGKWVLIPYLVTETGRMLQVNSRSHSINSTFSSRKDLSDRSWEV